MTIAPGCATEWAWTGWLPHTRPTTQPCHRLLAFDHEQAAARVAELIARLPSPGGPGHGRSVRPGSPERRTVVLVDGDLAGERLRGDLARLASEGPAAGVHLLCLAEAPAATPASPVTDTVTAAQHALPAFAACGMRGVLAGEVATSLRLLLPDGEAGPPATMDGVSGAWAERLARALAPLREGTGGDAEPLPESARLLDVLRLPRVTPAALRTRWEATEGLPLVLGSAVDGPLATDLAAAPGPLLVEGPARSGRTELLCSLAASLCATAGPRGLSLLLVDGPDEGLAPCAELPQVSERLRTTDPVRMRTFAQALRAELNRRAALLGEGPFETWTGEPAAAPLRVVGPRRGEDHGAGTAAPCAPERTDPLPRLVVIADDVAAL
ncbi:FtsK/SpoIIIE domain-containing protein, partial [Streptomyces sp. SM14]|uniref:FtsK/SpoIIIE domain-containing protein n=1 Tax=Streptomyces sp. SM14 TaxID=1736045 RepID=UPI0021566B91